MEVMWPLLFYHLVLQDTHENDLAYVERVLAMKTPIQVGLSKHMPSHLLHYSKEEREFILCSEGNRIMTNAQVIASLPSFDFWLTFYAA